MQSSMKNQVTANNSTHMIKMLINLQLQDRQTDRQTDGVGHSYTRHCNHDGDFLGLPKRKNPSSSRLGTCPNGCICIQFQGQSYYAHNTVTWGFFSFMEFSCYCRLVCIQAEKESGQSFVIIILEVLINKEESFIASSLVC